MPKRKPIKETIIIWDISVKFRKAGDKTVDITKPELKEYLDTLVTLMAQIFGVPKEDIKTNSIEKIIVRDISKADPHDQ